MTHGIPAFQLSDEDLERVLTPRTKSGTTIVLDGTVDQLRNHSSHTAELEHPYLERSANHPADKAAL